MLMVSQLVPRAEGDPLIAPAPTITAQPTVEEMIVDPSRVSAGTLGLTFFILFIVAAVVIYLSMRKQLKKVDFDEAATENDGRRRSPDFSDRHELPKE